MKIVIPVSKRDIHLADGLAKLFAKQGGLLQHKCLLVVPPSLKGHTGKLASELKPSFQELEVYQIEGSINEPDTEESSPFEHVIPANQMFQQTWLYLISKKNRDPIYWFEPDNTPTDGRWADELARDTFHASSYGKQALGAFLKVAKIKTVGGHILAERDLHEEYMMGSSIYPADIRSISNLWLKAVKTPFDVMMRWEMKRGALHTNKIINNHATKNYKVVEPFIGNKPATLSCDVINKWAVSSETVIVTKETLVIHGCKDNSLQDIILNGDLFKENTTEAEDKPKKTKKADIDYKIQ